MTQAIHTLDLFLSLTGMPDKVSATTVTSALHSMECEDTVAATLHYPSGAIGSIDATTAAYPGFPERICLNFTQGSATFEAGELQGELLDGQKIHAGTKQASGSGANLMGFDHHAHRVVLHDLVTAIRHHTEPAVTGRSALQVHRLIAALMASSRNEVMVSLQV